MSISKEELGELAVLFIEDAWQCEAFMAWVEDQGYTREEIDEARGE